MFARGLAPEKDGLRATTGAQAIYSETVFFRKKNVGKIRESKRKFFGRQFEFED